MRVFLGIPWRQLIVCIISSTYYKKTLSKNVSKILKPFLPFCLGSAMVGMCGNFPFLWLVNDPLAMDKRAMLKLKELDGCHVEQR